MDSKKIVFFIDKQKFKTKDDKQTASCLLSEYAKEDPDETTLVLKKGNELVKFDDQELICLVSGMHFVVFHDGPTPVSSFGPNRLLLELTDLGFEPEIVKGADRNTYVVIREFAIGIGKFVGRKIDLGLLAPPDYPMTVASAIHVKTEPQLYEKVDSIQNVRNITDSHLGANWRYWSINFNWVQGDSARRLLSKINSVFRHA